MQDTLPDLPMGGGMEMFENYKKIDVQATKEKLKTDATNFIKQLCDVYLQTDKIQRPEYVESIAKIETLTLTQLIGQVKYAEHVLDSLIRQLDAGGFTDASTYDMIMKMQNNSISITMQVSNFVRNLPEYFKHLEEDITKYQSIDMVRTGASNLKDTETGEDFEAETFDSAHVYRGTHDLMKRIDDARKAKAANRENVDAAIAGIDDHEVIDASELVKQSKSEDIEDAEYEED